jgi:hypothetical protein
MTHSATAWVDVSSLDGFMNLDLYVKTPCVFPSYARGCTDPNATNYDPVAAQSDGSCAYDCGALSGGGTDAACYI